MLAKYHEHPFNIETGDITFREVYENWSADKYKNACRSTINDYRASYNACTPIYQRKFRDLKINDSQDITNSCDKNYLRLEKLKFFSTNYLLMQ